MTDDTTATAENTDIASPAAEPVSTAEPAPAPLPAAAPSLLDEIMQDLSAVAVKIEGFAHEAAVELKSGVESLIARMKSL